MSEPTLYREAEWSEGLAARGVQFLYDEEMDIVLVPVKRCELDDILSTVPGIDKLTPVEYLYLYQAVTAWGAGIGGDDGHDGECDCVGCEKARMGWIGGDNEQ